MNNYLKRTTLTVALVLFCTTAFAQQLGETSTRSNIVNDLPVFEQLMVNGIKEFKYDDQGRIIFTSMEIIDRLETGMSYELQEKVSYDGSGNIISYKHAGFGAGITARSFEYNGNGDVIRQIIKSSDYGNAEIEYRYEYDKNGNLTSITSKGSPWGDKTVHFAYKYDEKGNATYAASDDGIKMGTGSYYFGNKEALKIKAWKPEINPPYLWNMKTMYFLNPTLGAYKISAVGHNDQGNYIETEMIEKFNNLGPFYLDSEFDKSGKVIYQINFQHSLRYSYNQKGVLETIKPNDVRRFYVTDEKTGEQIESAEEAKSNRYNYYLEYKHELDSSGRIVKEIEYMVTAK